jgi:hypothetical protein
MLIILCITYDLYQIITLSCDLSIHKKQFVNIICGQLFNNNNYNNIKNEILLN